MVKGSLYIWIWILKETHGKLCIIPTSNSILATKWHWWKLHWLLLTLYIQYDSYWFYEFDRAYIIITSNQLHWSTTVIYLISSHKHRIKNRITGSTLQYLFLDISHRFIRVANYLNRLWLASHISIGVEWAIYYI